MRYRVSKNRGTPSKTTKGKRITTTKYWLKRKNAQKYADNTNRMFKNARAIVVKDKKK